MQSEILCTLVHLNLVFIPAFLLNGHGILMTKVAGRSQPFCITDGMPVIQKGCDLPAMAKDVAYTHHIISEDIFLKKNIILGYLPI